MIVSQVIAQALMTPRYVCCHGDPLIRPVLPRLDYRRAPHGVPRTYLSAATASAVASPLRMAPSM
jgi:hypothetical protein